MDIVRNPSQKTKKIAFPLIKSALKSDAGSIKERISRLKSASSHLAKSAKEQLWKPNDPIIKSRNFIENIGINSVTIEHSIISEIDQMVQIVLESGEQ